MTIYMDKNIDTLCWLLELAQKKGATTADGLLVCSTDHSAAHRMGHPEDIERSESAGVGLRVFSGARQAIVSSTDLNKSALTQLAERAVAIAKVATEDSDSTLAPADRYAQHPVQLDLEDSFIPDADWLKEQAQAAEDKARSVEGISNSEGAQAYYNHTQQFLATIGDGASFTGSSSKSIFSISASVLAGEGTNMERDYAFSSARHCKDMRTAEAIGKEAADRTLRRLGSKKPRTGSMPVVFDPRTSRSLLSTFASAISGGTIARGTSFLKTKMNQQVFASGITICDDATRPRGLASRPFDGEGVATTKQGIVQEGILKSWLLDMRTANKLGLSTTGHASRGLSSAPSPSATNLYMENGTLSPDALMQDIKNGVYITETFGMGINIITGDYSQGAAGFAIENGQITHAVSEFTIAGKLADMFMHAAPANDLAFTYAVNAPTLRIDGMTVAGGGA